jgi:hypothetical protein
MAWGRRGRWEVVEVVEVVVSWKVKRLVGRIVMFLGELYELGALYWGEGRSHLYRVVG